MNNPYRSNPDTIPITWKERTHKGMQFLKDNKAAVAALLLAIALITMIWPKVHGCKEGAAVINKGAIINCDSAEETLHFKDTPEGTFMWCQCPGHDHTNDH